MEAATTIASLLQYHQVDYLGVAYADEGRAEECQHPVAHYGDEPGMDGWDVLFDQLEPEVYSLSLLHSLVAAPQREALRHPFKNRYGMHRLGFYSLGNCRRWHGYFHERKRKVVSFFPPGRR